MTTAVELLETLRLKLATQTPAYEIQIERDAISISLIVRNTEAQRQLVNRNLSLTLPEREFRFFVHTEENKLFFSQIIRNDHGRIVDIQIEDGKYLSPQILNGDQETKLRKTNKLIKKIESYLLNKIPFLDALQECLQILQSIQPNLQMKEKFAIAHCQKNITQCIERLSF